MLHIEHSKNLSRFFRSQGSNPRPFDLAIVTVHATLTHSAMRHLPKGCRIARSTILATGGYICGPRLSTPSHPPRQPRGSPSNLTPLRTPCSRHHACAPQPTSPRWGERAFCSRSSGEPVMLHIEHPKNLSRFFRSQGSNP